MGTELRILVAAEESAGMQLLRALSQTNHTIVGVLATPEKEGGQNVYSLASKMGYRTWPAKSVKKRSFAETVREEHVDVLLNVHSLYVITHELLEAVHLGAFNLHPGPLPRYAGLNAPSWAIYRGESRHGVTVHRMEPGVDTGDIIYQEMFDLGSADTGLTASAKCVRLGLPLVLRLIEQLATKPSELPRREQDLEESEYFGREVPHDGLICWSRPAAEIVNLVRGSDYYPLPSPWGHPRAELAGQEIGIVKAARSGRPAKGSPGTVAAVEDKNVVVAAADEMILVSHVHQERRYVLAPEVLEPGMKLGDGIGSVCDSEAERAT